MKVLKATPHARVAHIPRLSADAQFRRVPLCFDDQLLELGVIVDGVPSCRTCIENLSILIDRGERLVDMSTGVRRQNAQHLLNQLKSLYESIPLEVRYA